MRKKVISKAHRKKMDAGRKAAAVARARMRLNSDHAADALGALRDLNDEIDVQLASVKDDVVTVQRLVVLMDRALATDNWRKVSAFASAIHGFALGITRRIETCSATATAATKVINAIRDTKPHA